MDSIFSLVAVAASLILLVWFILMISSVAGNQKEQIAILKQIRDKHE